ncbi:ABC transporter ATP-binding protein [Arthrobacter sp. KFRI-F3372]|uniref:Peptide/nickel transport system ATP-binding protein n=1 Tax=Pseudarthrobacter oxydans TaxID=1671 RepID=A0AAW8N5F2_PSEOX|nr:MULTISPECIES: ABC transporter ATP-binding protein [Pseudarthrobacter]MDR6792419.1 peptide/nickel transport system ATP-binding protein [Pseudarthrobacter oxydans]MDR7162150.1 peptide/nickel transport system ATP-binding protein [Pseudarthrobacter oxydans]WHP58007.1 ABC transporter ATP-binding protein [Arthrobacter sp. KFRI-F3372]GKV71656.1 ABC transporter ATP-binding protein [Pseudarthrobacter sp. NCCP-2145]
MTVNIDPLSGRSPNGEPDDGRPVLDIDHLQVTFATDGGPVQAVKDVSLEVRKGEVLAIVGESGSGKTVTAKTILGLLPETASSSGAVLINGADVISVSAARLRQIRGRDVAMVFQEPSTALNPVFTVGWQIAEGIRAHTGSDGKRVSAKEAKSRAIEALRKVGIPDPEHRVNYYPHQFSGGQKQRVVIAAALALNPGLIVADEPTTALDVTVQAEILELLRDLRDKYGTSIVLITHNMGVVADLADRVVVMYQGDVVEEAPARTLFAEPRQDYTRSLLAAVPHLGRNSASAGLASRAHQEEEVLVEANNLSIEYPGRLGTPAFKAVDRVSFTLSRGEVFGLVGESGSGKTTIGRAIAGLNRTTGGSLKVLGYEMLNLKERTFKPLRKDIGFVFQDPAASFNPQLTIGDCIAEPMVIHTKPSPAQARKRVGELLESVQLPASYAGRYPHELSGGQRQRASLARALSLNPRLLIADEPTSALDVSVQAKVLELFRDIQQEFGFACLFISHDLAVVDTLSSWVGVLYKGRLVEQGIGSQVMGNPQHDYTRRLIASLPVPDPQQQAKRREAHRALLGI